MAGPKHTPADDPQDAPPAPDADADAAPEAEADQGPAYAELKRIVESLIFVADKPLPLARIRELTGVPDTARLEPLLAELVDDYRDRGIVLDDVAGGYQFHTSPMTARWVQQLVQGRPVRLTRAQLETLAIVAYRQPITRPEIDEIRGVDSGGTLKVLLDRSLVRVLGKREEPGRPLLYGTTSAFLQFFNLNELSDLPTLREYHELTEDSMREVEKLGAELEERARGGGEGDRGGDGDADGDGGDDDDRPTGDDSGRESA